MHWEGGEKSNEGTWTSRLSGWEASEPATVRGLSMSAVISFVPLAAAAAACAGVLALALFFPRAIVGFVTGVDGTINYYE